MEKDCAIILCTKNGAEFLADQLESLKNQTHGFDLYINDDGSDDKTEELIKNFQKKTRINIFYTQNIYNSAPKNFLNTLKLIKQEYSFYFFCDQDDIWEKNKIEISKKKLANVDKNLPCLFCTKTLIIDANSMVIDSSKTFQRPPCLSNAIVQSIAGGNTMCFNHKTKILLDQIFSINDVVSHDWITYLLVSAFEGKIIYSSNPLVKYRKHKNNLIGPNKSLDEMLLRINGLLRGQMRIWSEKNLNVLNDFDLPERSKEILDKFEKKAHKGNFFERFKFIFNSNVFRQTFLSNLALHFAILIRKI